jgi:hypothetical protein
MPGFALAAFFNMDFEKLPRVSLIIIGTMGLF